MKSAHKFTDKHLQNLKPKEKPYLETEGQGLYIRVSPNGKKSWLYIYSWDGKRKWFTIGSYPATGLAEARKRHRDAIKLLDAGKDPAAVQKAEQEDRLKAPTIDELIDEFLKRHVKVHATRSEKEYRRNLEKDVSPVWGKRKAQDIRRRDVHLLLEKILDRKSPNQANQVFKIIRKMFNFAVQREMVEFSPCSNISLPSPEKRKERFLTLEEIKKFWTRLPSCPISPEIQRALMLILITGQRPGEVVGAHSKEIDGDWWTIPAERSKNKKEQRVFLTDMAKELFGQRSGLIFPSPRGGKSIHVNALAHALRNSMKKNDAGIIPLPLSHFSPHDLRRTCATHLAELGFTDEVIGAVLNHTRQSVTAIYNRYRYDTEKKRALLAWERKVKKAVGDNETGKVVYFPA